MMKKTIYITEEQLYEYLDNQHGIPLLKYFSLTDEEKVQDLIVRNPEYFVEYFEGQGIEEEVFGDDYREMRDLFASDDFETMYNIITQNYPNYISEYARYLDDKINSQAIEAPAWYYLEDPSLVKNKWLIHFSDDAYNIAKNGFIYGVDDIDLLAYTTHLNQSAKEQGGYNFAYLASDFDRFYKGFHGKPKYGSEAVLFRASGVKLWHIGDEEYQVIFYGDTAKDFIYLHYDEDSYQWQIISTKTDRVLFYDEDLNTLVKWVENNYRQYQKHLH